MRLFHALERGLRNWRYNMTVRRKYGRHTLVLRRRDEIPHLLNVVGLTSEGVEIGVFQAEYAEQVLEQWKGRRYELIDPWTVYEEELGGKEDPLTQAAFDRIFEDVQKRVARFGDRAQFRRATSLDAADHFADNSLDFVYIDGLHTYEAVRDDVCAWYPKLKSGALMAGHDYMDGPVGKVIWGVKSAVDEFAREHGVRVGATQRDQPSWFFFKA